MDQNNGFDVVSGSPYIGIFSDGGKDAELYSGTDNGPEFNVSLMIRGKSGEESSFFTDAINVAYYNHLKVEFTYIARR